MLLALAEGNEIEIEAHRSTLQAQNIRATDKILPIAQVSASDRTKAKALRERAANLNMAGKLDETDRVLREAWKTLGHPELHQFLARA